jgi:hypothetical protein
VTLAIVLVDTSIFCEVLDVPSMNSDRDGVIETLEYHIKRGDDLLLPTATIVETGNHIAQCSPKGLRRKAAGRFVDEVSKALDGESPFRGTVLWERAVVEEILEDFTDGASRGLGFGDQSIVYEWERMRKLFEHRRVLIWSKDRDLQGYDTGAGT